MIRSDTIARFGSSAHSAGPTFRISSIPLLQPVGRGDLPTFSLFRDDGSDSQQPPPIHDDRHIFCWHTGLRPVYCLQTTLKGSRRTARGASPGKKHASSPPGNHPRSDPERVVQDKQRASHGDMDAQDASPEKPKRPAPPIQGGHADLPKFPGLAPRAVLPDPWGVLFDSLIRCVSRQPAKLSTHSVKRVPQPALRAAVQCHAFQAWSIIPALPAATQGPRELL